MTNKPSKLYPLDSVPPLPPPEVKDLRYPLISTTFKGYTERFKELASKHLHCSLDDHSPDYIPQDLKEGTYRWVLYIYSNLYTVGEEFDPHDRNMFISVSAKFKREHLISWTRDKLIELYRGKEKMIYEYLGRRIKETTNFFELKTCIYLFRVLSKEWFVTDSFTLERSPGLKEYIKHEK